VSIGRAFGDTDPVGRQGKVQDLRPDTGTGVIGVGTLACPDCDAPTAPGPFALGPGHGLRCPVCAHAALVRDFLSLAVPSRPARVVVRLTRSRGPRH